MSTTKFWCKESESSVVAIIIWGNCQKNLLLSEKKKTAQIVGNDAMANEVITYVVVDQSITEAEPRPRIDHTTEAWTAHDTS